MPAALITTLCFALTAVCATQATRELGRNRANLLRLVIAVVLLGLWAHAAGQGHGGGAFWRFYLAGTIGFGAGGWCMFQAFPRLGSTLSLLVVECAAAISSATFAWVFLGAALGPWQIAAGLLAIGGVVIGLMPFCLPELPRPTLLAGVAFAVLASVAQGVSWTVSKSAFMHLAAEGVKLDGLTAAYQRLLGGVTVAGIVYVIAFAGRRKREVTARPHQHDGWSRRGMTWALGNALAGPVLGVGFMLHAIREVGNPGVVQAVVATATLVSVPFSRLLETRTLRLNFYLGSALSIVGIAGLILTSK